MIPISRHVSGAYDTSGAGALWSRTVTLAAPAPYVENWFYKLPKMAKLLDIDVLTDGIPDHNPFLLQLDGEPAYTVEGEAEIPGDTTQTLVSTFSTLAGFGSQESDTAILIPPTSPQPGTGALPSSGVNVKHVSLSFPAIAGIPPLSVATLQRNGQSPGELGTWNLADGTDGIQNVDVPADGSNVTVSVLLRDVDGNPAYPFDWTTHTAERLLLVAIQSTDAIPAVTDRPQLSSHDPGLINVRYQFRRIPLDGAGSSDYLMTTTFERNDTHGRPIKVSHRPFFDLNDQAIPDPHPFAVDISCPRAIAYTHSARASFASFHRTGGNLPAGTTLTARAY